LLALPSACALDRIGAIASSGLFHRSPERARAAAVRPEILARVIGANSILNALFMVAAACSRGRALQRLSILQLVLLAAAAQRRVAIYIYTLVRSSCCDSCAAVVHTVSLEKMRCALSRIGRGTDRVQPRQLSTPW